MTRQSNPVERCMAQLCAQWNAAAEQPDGRIVVWNVSASGERLLYTFFEAQRNVDDAPLDYHAPDLFVVLNTPFDTRFGYSRSLCEALIGSYRASKKSFAKQNIAHDWAYSEVGQPESAAGFVMLLNAFAKHLAAQFRHATIVLSPSSISSDGSFKAWAEDVLKSELATNVRLVFVQIDSRPKWSWMKEEQPERVEIIDSPIDGMAVARETAAQSPGTGPAPAYRQMLTDVFTLVEKGTAKQTAARADAALKIAMRENWFDQQVVLHMAVAGAHQKEQNHAAAIDAYRRARVCAEAAKPADPVLGNNLVLQTWFGEAGVWVMSGSFQMASKAYVSAAEVAQTIGHRFFALEAYRMAAYCHANDGDAEQARHHGALAIREGKLMPKDERSASTLALALNDQLQLQDDKLAIELKRLAGEYHQQIDASHQQAEADASSLGQTPDSKALKAIELRMEARFEAAFQKLRKDREQVIAHGDEYFRKVIGVGRELLHPHWSGLPEVSHPLDSEPATWDSMPSSAELSSAAVPKATALPSDNAIV